MQFGYVSVEYSRFADLWELRPDGAAHCIAQHVELSVVAGETVVGVHWVVGEDLHRPRGASK